MNQTFLFIWKKIRVIFLDLLFPVSCQLCQKENTWLCDECFSRLEILDFQTCPYCEANQTPSGKICPKCRNIQHRKGENQFLDGLISATKYRASSRLIHLFKYRFIFDLGLPLGKLLAKAAEKHNLPLPDLIIPIPIHKHKLKWRGFNQAEILAKSLAENLTPGLSLPVETTLLCRQRNTPAQMKLKKYQERFSNIKDAFCLVRKPASEKLRGKNILLVDDVSTTGATLFECAKVLKLSGKAASVWAIIIARQKWSKDSLPQ